MGNQVDQTDERKEPAAQTVRALRKRYFNSLLVLTIAILLQLIIIFCGKISKENSPYASANIALLAAFFQVFSYAGVLVPLVLFYVHHNDWKNYPRKEAALRENTREDIRRARKYQCLVKALIALPIVIFVGTAGLLGYNYLESIRNQAWKYMEAKDYIATEKLLQYYPVNRYRDNGDMKSLAESLRYRAEHDYSLAGYCAQGVDLEGLTEEEQQRLDKYKWAMKSCGKREQDREIAERIAEQEEKQTPPSSRGPSSSRAHSGGSYHDEYEEDWDGEEYINEKYDDLYDDESFYDEIMDD